MSVSAKSVNGRTIGRVTISTAAVNGVTMARPTAPDTLLLLWVTVLLMVTGIGVSKR